MLAASVIAYLLARSSSILIFIAALICVIAGSWSTVRMALTRPLSQASLPVAAGLGSAIIVVGVSLPEMRFAVAPFMAFVVLLTSITSSRRSTVVVTSIATVIVLAILLLPPFSPLSLGAFTFVLQVIGPTVVTILIGLVADGFLASQTGAIALAENRAKEAEAARTEAETARAEAESRSAEQQRLLELVGTLELPVLSVGRGVLAVPLVGNLDSRRVGAITGAVLDSIARTRSQTVVFDITGVSTIDTTVARALIEAGQSIRLLGARAFLSGVRPGVAQILTTLDIRLDSFEPVADLHEALQATGTA